MGGGSWAQTGVGSCKLAAARRGTGLRSPWPRRASAGRDGAGIGASVLDWRPARSPVGVTCVPATEGRTPGRAERDMTWSGVTARTGAMLSGLPEHPGLAPRGAEHAAGLCPFAFLKEPLHGRCSLDL